MFFMGMKMFSFIYLFLLFIHFQVGRGSVTVYGYTVTVYGSLTLGSPGPGTFPVFLEYPSILDFNMLSHRYRYS
jgi:hypothetical protein